MKYAIGALVMLFTLAAGGLYMVQPQPVRAVSCLSPHGVVDIKNPVIKRDMLNRTITVIDGTRKITFPGDHCVVIR